MFKPTHYLIASNERKTEVCLEKITKLGWYEVRTALDWFSSSSIIQYHKDKGLVSYALPLEGYDLVPWVTDLTSQPEKSQSKAKKTKTGREKQTKTSVVKDFISVENRAYSGRQLMKQFKCGDRLFRIKRSQSDLTAWSKQRAPGGIAWKYQDDTLFLSTKIIKSEQQDND